MIKKWFFHRANYADPVKYNNQYDNDVCNRENEEMRKVLRSLVSNDLDITDIGCGTGLGRELLNGHRKYLGIDNEPKVIEFCKEHREGGYKLADANKYIDTVDKINPIFLFSMDYLKEEAIRKYINKTDRLLISIHYNKPYLSPTSVYSGRKWLSRIILPEAKKEEILELFQEEGATTYKLLDEEYYYVTILERK